MHKKRPEDMMTVEKPPRSDANTVLSSAGNGLTIGSVPLVTAEFAHIVDKKIVVPENLRKAGVFAAVTGCAIGAIVGIQEAKDINRYRNSLRQHLQDLRDQTNENTRKIESWEEKIRTSEKSEATIER